MKKRILLAVLLAATLLLSGCSLELKDAKVDALQTIVEVNGEHVTKESFLNTYSYNLYMAQLNAQMLAQFGISDGSYDAEEVMNSTLSSVISSLVLAQKAEELGFAELDEETLNTLNLQGQAEYEDQLNEIRDAYFADSELTGDALEAAVADYALSLGYSLNILQGQAQRNYVSDLLKKSVTDLVTVDDAQLQAALDEKIADEKALFESNPALYTSRANSGTQVYYTPAGYRTVRVIEIAWPAPAEGAEADTAAAREQIDALAARLDEGEAFDALGDAATYVISKDSTDLDAALIAAAMDLGEKEAVSAVVECAASFALVQYVDDVAEGSVSLNDVRKALHAEVLSTAQEEAYNAAVAAWVEEADVKLFPERLN